MRAPTKRAGFIPTMDCLHVPKLPRRAAIDELGRRLLWLGATNFGAQCSGYRASFSVNSTCPKLASCSPYGKAYEPANGKPSALHAQQRSRSAFHLANEIRQRLDLDCLSIRTDLSGTFILSTAACRKRRSWIGEFYPPRHPLRWNALLGSRTGA
jgi:hypothetical protein